MRPALLIVIACVLSSGCHKASPLVGDWEAKSTILNQNGTIHTSFGGDGKLKTTTVAAGKNGTSVTAVDTGTWKLEGKRLTVHIDDADWTFVGPEPRVSAARKRFESNRSQIIANANKDPNATIEWSGDDAFTITYASGNTETFHRVR
jgi:hypothetical protein